MIMNYKETNLQQLAKSIKMLLDDETCTCDEMYELILLTIGESINTHRDTTQKGKQLRDRLLGEVETPVFRSFSSSIGNDTISFNDSNKDSDDYKHSYHYYQHNRNK